MVPVLLGVYLMLINILLVNLLIAMFRYYCLTLCACIIQLPTRSLISRNIFIYVHTHTLTYIYIYLYVTVLKIKYVSEWVPTILCRKCLPWEILVCSWHVSRQYTESLADTLGHSLGFDSLLLVWWACN